MYETFGQYLKARLLALHGETDADTQGCTEEEIQTLMQVQGVTFLPEVYRQFLLTMGRSTGGLIFSGSDATYLYLLELKQDTIDILKAQLEGSSNSDFQLPSDAFVFFMHQGYEFCYFLTDAGDDNPAVYIFYEGEGIPTQGWSTLTGFFDSHIDSIKVMLSKWYNKR